MWFYSESLRSSCSELLFTLISPTSLAVVAASLDASPGGQTFAQCFQHRGGKIKWRMENDNLFFAETNFELDVVHRNL